MNKQAVFLFAFANDTLHTLALDKEFKVAKNALKNHRDKIDFNSTPSVNREDIWELFNDNYKKIYCFHFGGHSDGDGLELVGAKLNGKSLATLLGQEENLKLVFLNGCTNVKQVDQLMEKGIPAVVATSAPISDPKSVELSKRFYSALAAGRSIKKAFEAAVSFIEKKGGNTLIEYRGLQLEKSNTPFEWALYINEDKKAVETWSITELIEKETQTEKPKIATVSAVQKIENNKSVLIDSPLNAGGDITIGDTTVHTESKTSKRLRLFLFLFVPLLAIVGTYFWYQNQVAKQPLSMKVLLENTTPNRELSEPNGILTLTYGGEPKRKNNIQGEALFENIPSNFRKEWMRLEYETEGFVKLDTSFIFKSDIKLSLKRNDDYALLQGYIYEEDTEPLEGIEGVQVSIACCSTKTDISGKFILSIPFEHQRRKQRLELFREGYEQNSTTEPVIKGELIKTFLEKK